MNLMDAKPLLLMCVCLCFVQVFTFMILEDFALLIHKLMLAGKQTSTVWRGYVCVRTCTPVSCVQTKL